MQEISSNDLLNLIQYFLLRLRQCLIFRTLQWVCSVAPIIIHINLERVLKFLVDDTHYWNRLETGTSGGSTDIVARKSLEVRIRAMIKDCSSFILLKIEKNLTLSKQLEGIGVLEAIVHAWKAKSRNVKSSRGWVIRLWNRQWFAPLNLKSVSPSFCLSAFFLN